MTILSELPVELILHICSFIHPRQSIRATFRPDVTQEESFDDIRESWVDLRNLSRTSHQYRAIIEKSHLLYRTICVTGKLSQLVIFLKWIRSRPDIAASVHRLFVYHQWVSVVTHETFMNRHKIMKESLALIEYIDQTAWELCVGSDLETRGQVEHCESDTISDHQRALIKGILMHIQTLGRQGHASLSCHEPFDSSDFPTVPFLNSVTLVVKPIRMHPKPPETRVVTYCILNERQLMKTIRESRRDASTSLR